MRATVLAAASRSGLLRGAGLAEVGYAFNNTVPGCVDLRRDYADRCEFDGRFSVAAARGGGFLVYVRANMNADGGGRYVSVARRASLAGDGGWAYAPIRFLEADDSRYGAGFWTAADRPFHDALRDVSVAAARANVYFAAVNPNPLDGGATLLGLFPTAVEVPDRTDAREAAKGRVEEVGATLLSVSVDGVRWAPPIALAEAFPVGGESTDHPIDGVVLRGDALFVYVHAGVPGTLSALCNRDRPPAPPPSRIVRLALKADALRAYAADAVARLQAAPP